MENTRFKHLIIRDKHKWLIKGAITAWFHNTLKPKALPRRARGKNRTKSSSLLLNLAKRTKPGGEVASAKCGAIT